MSAPPLSPVSENALAVDEIVDFRRMLLAVLRYKWGILGLAFVITVAAGLWVYSQQAIYRATASIVLETEQANLVAIEEMYSSGAGHYDYFTTQYEILKSRNLAERVVRRLQLHKHPAFNAPVADGGANSPDSYDLNTLKPARNQLPPVQLTEQELEQQSIAAITAEVAGGLTVQPVEYSYIVYLSYESRNPELAARIVNTLASEYIESDLENRVSGTVRATAWLNERLLTLRENLRASELALQDFRDREQLVDVEGVTGLGGQELRDLAARLEEARRLRIQAQNVKAEVERAGGAVGEELLTVPVVLQHELVRSLRREQSSAQRRASELAKRYGPKHPKMIAARSDLEAANSSINNAVKKIVQGIDSEFEITQRNERELQSRWEKRKSEVQDFNRKEFELRDLQREVETNRQLYDIFFTRIRETDDASGFERPHARILDAALVPSFPVRPDKQRTMLIAFLCALLLGSGIALLLDHLDDTVQTPDQVMEKLGVPILGSTPRMDTDGDDGFEQFWDNPQGHYAECMRTIRTGVILSNLDKPARIIVLTSSLEGEGKSAIAINLGAAMAQMERTLVIGADLRRPSLAKRCGLSANHKGLSHFVSGGAELSDCIEFLPETTRWK
jgi:uncharacterized protein involved in exopolysaccharide biosynthesis